MRILFGFFIAALVILSMILSDWSEARNVTFLPRDEELQTISQNYNGTGYVLQELPCTASSGADQLDRSMACVGARLDCPNCCLSWDPLVNGRPTMLSTPIDDPAKYQSKEILFNSNDGSGSNVCPAVRDCTRTRPPFPKENCSTNTAIPYCQERGCPGVDGSLYINAKPYLMSEMKECEEETPGDPSVWLCTSASVSEPTFQGCPALSKGYGCSKPVFNKSSYGPCPFKPGKNCTRYEFSSTYKACIERCIAAARGFERYERDTNCLLNGDVVCPAGPNGSGFMQNCVTYQCQGRIDWPECQSGSAHPELCCDNSAMMDPSKILAYQQAYNKCFDRDTREGGGCLDCFQPLGTKDKPFQYDFVARSNQKIFVIWQLQVTPQYCLTMDKTCPAGSWDVGSVPTSYLYTAAKVFDITDGQETEIFPGTSTKGTLSQRAFAGAFSVFAAAAINKKDDNVTNFFEQGHRYRVKLYWYIPSISNAILQANVLWAQLTVIKTRD